MHGWGCPVALEMCQRHVSESHAVQSARAVAMSAKSGAPTCIAIAVLLDLEPVRAGDAAALALGLDHLELGDQLEQVERRLAEAVTAALAGLVVGDAHRQRAHVGAQLALVEEVAQELADVEGARSDERQIVVVDAEDVARLALQHQAAAGRVGDDHVPFARVRREPRDQRAHVLAGRLEGAV